MKIACDVPILFPSVTKSFTILTDGAVICVNNIVHDREQGLVVVPLRRRKITGFNKSIIGEFKPTTINEFIPGQLLIKKVESVTIHADKRLHTDCGSCFTVMFGLKITTNSIYLGSVEEFHGEPLCQISIFIKGIYIEYFDLY